MKKLLSLLLVLALMFSLAGCGLVDTVLGLFGGDKLSGVWVAKTISIDGKRHSDLFMDMWEVSDYLFMELAEKDKANIYFFGSEYDGKWEKESSTTGTVDFMDLDATLEYEKDELILYIDDAGDFCDTMEIIFEASEKSYKSLVRSVPDMDGYDDGDYDDYGGDDSYEYPDTLKIFEGDWMGALYLENVPDAYGNLEDRVFLVVARFSFRNGYCDGYLAVYFGDEVAVSENFQGVWPRLQDGYMEIGCSLLGYTLNSMRLHYDTASNLASADVESYDASVVGELYMRPWGVTWPSGEDVPHPHPDDVALAATTTLEEIVEMMGRDAGEVPARTFVADTL